MTKHNAALQAVVGQLEMNDRMKELDSDQQLCELKSALADAAAENERKSVELTSLSAAVDTLTCEIDVSKVVLIFLLC